MEESLWGAHSWIDGESLPTLDMFSKCSKSSYESVTAGLVAGGNKEDYPIAIELASAVHSTAWPNLVPIPILLVHMTQHTAKSINRSSQPCIPRPRVPWMWLFRLEGTTTDLRCSQRMITLFKTWLEVAIEIRESPEKVLFKVVNSLLDKSWCFANK